MKIDKYTQICSTDDIDQRVKEMAAEIIAKYPDTRPVFVALLRGAMPFAAKLMFEITRQAPDFHPEVDYLTIRTYGNERSAAKSEIITDLIAPDRIKNRAVIALDDVIDRGHTFEFVKDLLIGRGSKKVELAVLADKNVPDRQTQADYVGFTASDKWLTGMGLDDVSVAPEAHRWLEGIWEYDN